MPAVPYYATPAVQVARPQAVNRSALLPIGMPTYSGGQVVYHASEITRRPIVAAATVPWQAPAASALSSVQQRNTPPRIASVEIRDPSYDLTFGRAGHAELLWSAGALPARRRIGYAISLNYLWPGDSLAPMVPDWHDVILVVAFLLTRAILPLPLPLPRRGHGDSSLGRARALGRSPCLENSVTADLVNIARRWSGRSATRCCLAIGRRSRAAGQAPALGHAVQSQQTSPQGFGARLAIGFASDESAQLGDHAYGLI